MPTIEEIQRMAEEGPEYTPPRPPIGLPVQWFPHGNVNTTPFAAVITETTDRGIVSLTIYRPNGGTPFSKRGCWYMHDPAIAKRDRGIVSEGGVWGYIPGTAALDINEMGLAPKTALESMPVEEAILTLHNSGWAASDIAKKLAIAHQKVTHTVRVAAKANEGKEQEKVAS